MRINPRSFDSIEPGAYAIIATANLYHLGRKRLWWLFGYTALMCALTTIYYGVGINYNQALLIDQPFGGNLNSLSTANQIVDDVMGSVSIWMGDGFIVSLLLFSITIHAIEGSVIALEMIYDLD